MNRPTIIPVSLGGSGKGISWYEAAIKCPRARWLDDQDRALGYEEGGNPNIAALIGTVFHAFAAYYYEGGKDKRGFDTACVEFRQDGGGGWNPEEKALAEGERLFRAYRAKFPPNEFGRVFGVEKHYKVSAREDLPWKPRGLYLTGALDLEVNITAAGAKRVKALRGLDLEPGYYIVDHKTSMNYHPILLDKYRMSIQATAYQLIWQRANPKKELKGFLFNLVTGKSKVDFKTLVVPPPLGDDVERLHNVLTMADEFMSESLPFANPTACLDYAKVCKHWSSGRCGRY